MNSPAEVSQRGHLSCSFMHFCHFSTLRYCCFNSAWGSHSIQASIRPRFINCESTAEPGNESWIIMMGYGGDCLGPQMNDSEHCDPQDDDWPMR